MGSSGSKQPEPHKWIVLGGGEVGKSSIVRNIISYYGMNILDKDWLSLLQDNTWFSMKVLAGMARRVYSKRRGGSIADDLEQEFNIVDSYDYDNPNQYTMEVAAAIERLWQDPFIRQCYTLRHEFHLMDSAGYLLDRATQWADPNYTVTLLNTLHTYHRTTGVEEFNVTIHCAPIRIFDTGGQKTERKKWISLYENTPSILFVVAISHYNQLMYENEQTNRLVDSLDCFEDTINLPYLGLSRFVLVFNKMDVFRDKIQTYPLRDYFPDYDGPQQDADAAQAWIVQQFRNRIHANRNLQIYFTTATDMDQMRAMIPAIANGLHSHLLVDG